MSNTVRRLPSGLLLLMLLIAAGCESAGTSFFEEGQPCEEDGDCTDEALSCIEGTCRVPSHSDPDATSDTDGPDAPDADTGDAEGDSDATDDPDTDEEGDPSGDADPDADGDTQEDTEPCEGEFLCPCERGSDCNSGRCVRSPNQGFVCADFCQGTCTEPTEGWECRPLASPQGDVEELCLPVLPVYCTSCLPEDHLGCGRSGDYCLNLVDGWHCGVSCSQDSDCAPDARCTSHTVSVDGENRDVRQCTPERGFCAGCLDADNDGFGIGPECEGPQDCDDGNPNRFPGAPEICNNEDTNCDGTVDTGFRDPSTGVYNTLEHCGRCNSVCSPFNGFGSCATGVWVRWIPGSGRQNQTHFGGWKSTSESS